MENTQATSAPLPKKTKRHNLAFGLGKEKDYVIENLSLLIGSGVDIAAALTLLKSDVRSTFIREALDSALDEMKVGSSFWQALSNSNLFPPYMIALIKIGEENGRLAENLKIVALQDERDRTFRSQVRSAMMYPLFVFALTIIIGLGVSWFILPRLANIFHGLKMELPLVTRLLFTFGQWLGKYGTFAVPLILVGVMALVYFIFFFSKTKFIGQKILFKLPGIKRLLQELEISRFGFLVGTLLEAGIPITPSINSLVEATFFPNYKKLYTHIQTHVDEGDTIKNSLASFPHSTHYIPSPVQGIIAASEQSGTMSQVFLKLGQSFATKAEISAKNLTVLIEPFLLIIVWLGVMGVALAVFLPIYNLTGGLSR